MRFKKPTAMAIAILMSLGLQLPAQATSPATITMVTGWDGVVGPATRIFISLHFTEPVTVAGAPKVNFSLGGQDRVANFYRYRAGSDQILDFDYVITRSDSDGEVIANSVNLDGGSITTDSNSLDADLTLPIGANVEDFSNPSIDTVGPVLLDAYVFRDMVVFDWDERLISNWGSFAWRYKKNGVQGGFIGYGSPIGEELFEVHPGRSRSGSQNQKFLRLDAPVLAGDEVVIELNNDPLMAMDVYYNQTSDASVSVQLRNLTPVSSSGSLGYETLLWDGDCAGEAVPEFIGALGSDLYFAARGEGVFNICRINASTGATGNTLPIQLRTTNSIPGPALVHDGAVWVESEDIENGFDPALVKLEISDGNTTEFPIPGIPSESSCLDTHSSGSKLWIYCVSESTDSVVVFDSATESFSSVIDLGTKYASIDGLLLEFGYETSTNVYLTPSEGSSSQGGFAINKADLIQTFDASISRIPSVWNDEQVLYHIDYSPLGSVRKLNASGVWSGYSLVSSADPLGFARDIVKVEGSVYVLSTPGDTDAVGFLTKYDQDLALRWRIAISGSGSIIDSSPQDITIQAASGRVFKVNISAPHLQPTSTTSQDSSVTMDFTGMDFGSEGNVALVASTTKSFSTPVTSVPQAVSGDATRSFRKIISGLQPGTAYYVAPVFERNGLLSYGSAQLISTTGSARVTPPAGGGGGGFFPLPQTPVAVVTSPIPPGAMSALVDDLGNRLEINEQVVTSDGKMLLISAGPISLVLTGNTGSNFSSEGQLRLSSGAPIELNASGYQPGSEVSGFLVPKSQLASVGLSAFNSAIQLGSVTVDSDGSFAFKRTIEAPPGDFLLQISGTSSEGKQVTFVLETSIAGTQSQGLTTWTKRLAGGSQAKLYAKNVIGEGKVSLRLNGKEIAWVRAVDETDPKLRVVTSGPMSGANYLVRTVNLQKGKNVLEVYVNGVRMTRTAYSRG